MRDATRAAFPPFTAKHEGRTRWIGLDGKGRPCGGLGFDWPAPASPLELAWLRRDGTIASPTDVANEWRRVSAMASDAGDVAAFERTATILATDASIDACFARKMARAELAMLSAFAAWPTWCADLQLDALSRCWALGTAWPSQRFPHFAGLLRAGQWRTACGIDPATGRPYGKMLEDHQNASFRDRNAAGLVMVRNCAAVNEQGLDANALYWPRDLDAEGVDVEV